MTASKEQERVSLPLDLVNDLLALCTPEDHELRERVKQASRRAQGVPYELRNAAQRAHDWMERQAKAQGKGGHATFDLMMLREERDALAAALSAAPQPPAAQLDEICVVDMAQAVDSTEAAPVQLPDPAASAYISEPKDDGTVCTEMMVNPGLCTTGWNMLYTEHQVRPLLAAQQFTLDELAMLTRKLVQQLRKASPGDESAEKALDYLKRKGLAGNPLRTTQELST